MSEKLKFRSEDFLKITGEDVSDTIETVNLLKIAAKSQLKFKNMSKGAVNHFN